MFDHPKFKVVPFAEVPLNRDITLMDEKWASDYEKEWIKHFDDKDADLYIGYVSYVAARSVGGDWLELSWYPNISDRFHEVPIFLPKSAFVACLDLWSYDEKPRIFVKSVWLTELHERPLAAFAIVDAIGVKARLQSGGMSAVALRALRDRIDVIADRYPSFAFISFADSLLVKQVWSVGHVHSHIKYTYSPEALFPVIAELRCAFQEALGLPAYAIVTQGLNAYADDTALHRSASGNHVSLNTLGLPFAQLMSIEDAARKAIRAKTHMPAELYLDSTLFRSLKTKPEFNKDQSAMYPYRSPMTKSPNTTYVAASVKDIVDNLR